LDTQAQWFLERETTGSRGERSKQIVGVGGFLRILLEKELLV